MPFERALPRKAAILKGNNPELHNGALEGTFLNLETFKVLGKGVSQMDLNDPICTDHKPRLKDIRSVPLKKRELDILQLLFDGLTNREIAQRMNLSPYTVRNYISGLLFKFQARNRTELLARFTSLRRRYHRRLRP
jgi:DNA-binding CsgD family transcriptional regulator